jgi:hypothetical protein
MIINNDVNTTRYNRQKAEQFAMRAARVRCQIGNDMADILGILNDPSFLPPIVTPTLADPNATVPLPEFHPTIELVLI